MQSGAVVVLDAVGFKGIWKSWKPEAIIASLKTAASYAKERATPGPVGTIDLVVRQLESQVRVFSDTVVLTVACSPRSEEETSPLSPGDVAVAESVKVACSMASRFVGKAGCLDPPLVYRGAVSAGAFVIDEEFLLGPAVDEAASEEKRAEGAFIWLAPSALSAFEKYAAQLGPVSPRIEYNYRVPMKGGHTYRTHVVNPILSIPEPREESIRRLLATFSRSQAVDVAIKRQNTEAFLLRALDAVRKFEKRPST
jgi:hypothetical protein